MRCPICGEEPAKDPLNSHSDHLTWHLWRKHCPHDGWRAWCWCGFDLFSSPEDEWTTALENHCSASGGLEAHYMDYLMGVSKQNQLTQGD